VSPVVPPAASGVGEELIGVGNRPEPLRRGRVTAAQVRMRPAHEPAVGAHDLLSGGVGRHAEHLVRISRAAFSRHQDHPSAGQHLTEIQ
jgi:hypothetical protein